MRNLFLGLGAFVLAAGWTLGGDAAEDEQQLKDARLASDGPGLLRFFKERAVASADEAKINALIKQLGNDDFAKREEASQRLVAIGARARGALKKASDEKAPDKSDIEVVRRAQDCLKKIEQGATSAVIAAGIRTLARQKPEGSVQALLAYLPSAEDDMVAEEIRVAL